MASSDLAQLQARQVVQKFHQLKASLDNFASHATVLASSKAFDPRIMLEEANKLLGNLTKCRVEFEKAKGLSVTLSRTLSSRPPAGGGMAPAAQWGNEFRAGSKQFVEGIAKAEAAVQKLYKAAYIKINLPTRTATSPDNWFEAFLTLVDMLNQIVEFCKKSKK